MTLLYYNPIFLEHDTGGHPECAERLQQVVRHLKSVGLDRRCIRPSWKPVSAKRLAEVHASDYTSRVKIFCEQGGGQLEQDTVTSARSYEAALLAAGAVCDAVRRVVRGEDLRAFCLVRPPGHHALANQAMGFCLLNHVALGARMAVRELDLERVLIVDWDVHHGNGTQAIFWEERQVGYFSIHRWPFYPGTGAADETGSGSGLGTTVNLPIRFGTSRNDYLRIFSGELGRFADAFQPQLVMISAGFDSHHADPIGSLGLETEDFQELTQAVLDVAQVHCGGKVVSVLEGGYNPDALAASVEIHLQKLQEVHR